MSDEMTVLRRDYLMDELKMVTDEAGVTGTIAVQARQTLAETEWLSEIAAQNPLILGVVGWVPLVSDDVGVILESVAKFSKVKGIRHVLHDEADDRFMLRDDFNRGIARLKDFNLTYDLLIFERHLPQTIEFVDRHLGQVFVVDHIAKPRIKDRSIAFWRDHLRELAKRENIYCKLSGMVTEVNWHSWTGDDLKAYFDVTLEIFGPARLMFGSDWPVLTVASSYLRWMRLVEEATAGLSQDDRERIFHGTAVEAYSLSNSEAA